jgi:hypothetical protein
MSLAKQHFAKLRVLLSCYTYMIMLKWCDPVKWSSLPDAWSCAVIALFSATVACWWRWLASSLPSPPGSAPGLSFSSWTYCWSPVLLLLGLVLSFSWIPWCLLIVSNMFVVLWKNCGVLCVGSLLFRMWAASPGDAHLVGSLVYKLLWCCQHHPPGSVTKLLVSCVLVSFTQFDLILTWPCCETAMCSIVLYPSDLKEQMLHLGKILNDAMAKYLP